MKGRLGLLGALLAVTLTACESPAVVLTPPPTTAPTAAPSTPVPTRSPAPTTPAPTPSPTATATASTAPGSTPNPACPTQTGGAQANRAVITAIRIAHNPGFDRLVFELGPNAVGPYGLPPYTVQVASTFIATSGQPVHVDGNAFFLVRLDNTDAHDQTGKVTVSSTDYKPTTPLIKEVRVVEDFEAVNRWAVGLDHLVCPTILTLTNPIRLVVDFPTPP